MESDIQAMHRDLDEAILARRTAEERADHLQNELNRLSDQLRGEHEKYSNSESARKSLEVQIKEITIRLEEAESTKDGKKTLAKLQNRVILSYLCTDLTEQQLHIVHFLVSRGTFAYM